MHQQIGQTAGDIWRYLSENGPATAIQMKTALGIPNGVLHLALGWLAREDKVTLEMTGNAVIISLKVP